MDTKFLITDSDVVRLLNYGNRTQGIASKALKNEIVPFPGFESTNFDEYMWEITKKQKYGNTYILYIHTLRVCAELLNYYERTNVIEYFEKAEEIILSWIEYSRNEEVHEIVWYDHTTANRAQVIIQYLYLAQKLKRDINMAVFHTLLIKHAEVLNDDSKYKFNNHGLMMDRSLMILGNILNHKAYKMKGRYRAINTFWYSFSFQGIHLENSPQYHKMVLKMYIGIEKYLNSTNDSLGEVILEYIKLAEKNLSVMIKPNKQFASIGDSDSLLQKHEKIYENIYDVEAGLGIIQHKLPTPLYTTFICGYSSKVHKHNDDLSVTLNYNYKDFLLDPGKYSYTRDAIRKYITSSEAHSSYYLAEFDYSINNKNRFKRKVKLSNFYENEFFTIISGVNQDYEGISASLERHVIQFKNLPLILLVDNLNTDSKEALEVVQKFNLANDVIISTEDVVKLSVDDTTLSIQQFHDTTGFNVINGDKSIPIAVNSNGFAKVIETKQLEYRNVKNNGNSFLTAIYDEKYIDKLNVTFIDSTLKIVFNDQKYYIHL